MRNIRIVASKQKTIPCTFVPNAHATSAMNCSQAKIIQVRELSDTLDENLRHAKALLDVALTGDFVSLDAHTQYDFLSVLDDKMNVAMQAHRAMVATCNTIGES